MDEAELVTILESASPRPPLRLDSRSSAHSALQRPLTLARIDKLSDIIRKVVMRSLFANYNCTLYEKLTF